MITLYGFGRAAELPDPSPFVVKAEVLLKMAGLPYVFAKGDPTKAPKRKLPYIDDGGVIVADTTLMRLHIEKTRNFDFDKGLGTEQKGVAWAIEKMIEDHVYWHLVHERWLDAENFDRGPRRFFDGAPAPLRPLIIGIVRRKIAKSLYAQGLGRYSAEERARLGRRAVDALAACLGDKPWLMGAEPCGADATAFAIVSTGLWSRMQGPLRDSLEAHAKLVAYRQRGMATWFPELAVG